MTIHVCNSCGVTYDDNASVEHVCPDDVRDDRIDQLEREVAALRAIVTRALICTRVAMHRPPKTHDFIVLQSWVIEHEGELD